MVSERVVLTPKTEESSDVYSRVCHPGLVPGSAYTVLLTYTESLALWTPNQSEWGCGQVALPAEPRERWERTSEFWQ